MHSSAMKLSKTNNSYRTSTSPIEKLWGLILFSLSSVVVILFLLVLLTYNQEDPGFSHISSGGQVSNLLGTEGAWVADFLYLLFGFGSWILGFAGSFFLVRSWQRAKGTYLKYSSLPMGLRLLALFILILACCPLFFLRLYSYGVSLPATTGGAVGSTIGTELLYWVNFDTATVLLLVVVALTVSIFFDFSWIKVCEGIGGFFEEAIIARLKRRNRTKERLENIDSSKDGDSFRQTSKQVLEKNEVSFQQPVDGKSIGATNDTKNISESIPIHLTEGKKDLSPEQNKLEVDEPDDVMKPVIAELPQDQAIASFSFQLPNSTLLNEPIRQETTLTDDYFNPLSRRIEMILADFNIEASVKGILKGPVITRFRLLPKPGEKAKSFVKVASDLARRLGITSVRVVENLREADFIGLEIPNPPWSVETINFRRVIESPVFQKSTAPLTLGLGVDVSGQAVVTDLAKAPHLLIAGTTGSGKSVGVNSMILSMLFKNTPEQLRLILIDPKQVEFTPYVDIPHLITPVISDMSEASRALGWACKEMERRYTLFSKSKVRNIDSYNEKVANGVLSESLTPDQQKEDAVPMTRLPYLVVIIDELADLLQTHKKEVEPAIIQLAQKARASGIHLILATQRPSAKIITPVIKSNCPTRISFKVGGRTDSAIILDQQGAEDLLGRGDMLLRDPTGALIRIHGAFVADKEIEMVTNFLKAQGDPVYVDSVISDAEEGTTEVSTDSLGKKDQLYDTAVEIVVNENRASVCYLQRRLKIGYNRAANLVERMEKEGIVSEPNSIGKRQVLVSNQMKGF